MNNLRVPCSYQGGKQRIADEIVRHLISSARDSECDSFYDLCSGSGAISIELINQGIQPSQITMLDKSSWGVFWKEIGEGTFDLDRFSYFLDFIPDDKRQIREAAIKLSKLPIGNDEAYLYPILQSCSFGGKQITRSGGYWQNAFFRNYWEPNKHSVRQSPANPMQPAKKTLFTRVSKIVQSCVGINVIHDDVLAWANKMKVSKSIYYVDPPYQGTTEYHYDFDIREFINVFRSKTASPLFISESFPLSDEAFQLEFGGAKGGISGTKHTKHPEWLSPIPIA